MRRLSAFLTLLALLGIAAFGALWAGIVPPAINPLQPIDLAEPDPWFLDFRIARLKRDEAGCRRVLVKPNIEATPVGDHAGDNGCGWHNAVRVATVGSARLGVDKLTCQSAASLAMWMTHVVQPAAREHFGTSVASVQTMGTYACRNIIGDKSGSGVRSEHAKANAIDVSGFTLTDGRQINLLKQWNDRGASGRFLRAAHRGACRYFRTTLGPDYNAAHKDHFHLDRGWIRACE